MSLLEDRIIRILELRSQGFNEEKIAGELGLTTEMILQYEQSTVDRVKAQLAKGNRDYDKIGREIGLSSIIVKMLIFQYKISIPENLPKKIKMNERRTKIRELISRVSSIEELCKETGLRPSSLQQYCAKEKISLPDNLIPYKLNPRLDEMIQRGSTLREIGNKFGKTMEWARQYIGYTGQYKLWRESREHRKEKTVEKIVLGLLNQLIIRKAYQESWATGKAYEYYLCRRKGGVTLETLVGLFSLYEKAVNDGKPLSLQKLGASFNLYPAQVRLIFWRAGVDASTYHIICTRTSDTQKEMINRAHKSLVGGSDAAYFIGVCPSVVYYRFPKLGRRTSQLLASQPSGAKITYSFASQVYEARDAGFNDKEICELVGVNEKTLKIVLDKRKKFEPKIVQALQVIYGNKKINKPYRT